jgi:hypothetical protein
MRRLIISHILLVSVSCFAETVCTPEQLAQRASQPPVIAKFDPFGTAIAAPCVSVDAAAEDARVRKQGPGLYAANVPEDDKAKGCYAQYGNWAAEACPDNYANCPKALDQVNDCLGNPPVDKAPVPSDSPSTPAQPSTADSTSDSFPLTTTDPKQQTQNDPLVAALDSLLLDGWEAPPPVPTRSVRCCFKENNVDWYMFIVVRPAPCPCWNE